MVNEKALAANSSLFSSTNLKTQSTNMKRLAGGIRKLDSGKLDLTDAESKALAAAMLVLDRAAHVYEKASRIKAMHEKRQKDLDEAAIKLVRDSEFARLNAIDDIVAFIAAMAPYLLQRRDDINSVWSAQYLIEGTFMDCLDSHLALGLARRNQPMGEALADAWTRFQKAAPALKIRYAPLTQKVRELLEPKAVADVQGVMVDGCAVSRTGR